MKHFVRRALLPVVALAAITAPVVAASPAFANTYVTDHIVRRVGIEFHDYGQVAGHVGNAHTVFLWVGKSTDGTITVEGYEWDLQCAPGVVIDPAFYWGDEDESDCPLLRTLDYGASQLRLRMHPTRLDVGVLTGTLRLVDASGAFVRDDVVNISVVGFGDISHTIVYDRMHTNRTKIAGRLATASGTYGAITIGDGPNELEQDSGLESDVYKVRAD